MLSVVPLSETFFTLHLRQSSSCTTTTAAVASNISGSSTAVPPQRQAGSQQQQRRQRSSSSSPPATTRRQHGERWPQQQQPVRGGAAPPPSHVRSNDAPRGGPPASPTRLVPPSPHVWQDLACVVTRRPHHASPGRPSGSSTSRYSTAEQSCREDLSCGVCLCTLQVG